jgi:ATP-dependent Clp protease protease subunit
MAQQPLVIKFFAPVIDKTVNALIDAVERRLRHGPREVTLLISSPGGNVHYGLSAYNYLKGLPIQLTTHNFGSVDSIAGVLFCAGSTRLSVPHARFLLHAVVANFPQCALEEKQLEERLKGLKIDIENIAKVVSANSNRPLEDVTQAMLDRTTLSPEEAVRWGLVHAIKTELVPSGVEVFSIQHEEA